MTQQRIRALLREGYGVDDLNVMGMTYLQIAHAITCGPRLRDEFSAYAKLLTRRIRRAA
jgi:aspartate ammonia-lyase